MDALLSEFALEKPHPPPSDCWTWLPIMLRKLAEPGRPIELPENQKRDRVQFDRWYDVALRQVAQAIRLLWYFEHKPKPEAWFEFIATVQHLADTYSGWKEDGRIEWLPNSYRLKGDRPIDPPDTDCVEALTYYLAQIA
jgi:hypothetical protein